jgi:hypothetical protein
MWPDFIVEALTSGIMKGPGDALSAEQRVTLAEYLTGKKVGVETPMAGRCIGPRPPLAVNAPSYNGWAGAGELAISGGSGNRRD